MHDDIFAGPVEHIVRRNAKHQTALAQGSDNAANRARSSPALLQT